MEKVACWATETHEAETRPSLQSRNLEVQGERFTGCGCRRECPALGTQNNSNGAAVCQDTAECLTCHNSSVHKAHVQYGSCIPRFTAEEIKAQTDSEP